MMSKYKTQIMHKGNAYARMKKQTISGTVAAETLPQYA